MSYENLFSPRSIGKVLIKNRVVMPAMMLDHGQFDGTPTEQMMDYYEERAKGGVGLIITEITRINDIHGVGSFAQLAVSQDYHTAPLAEMVKRIHKHDCKVFVQLHHPGMQGEPLTVGTIPLAVKVEKMMPAFRKAFYKMTPFARKLQEKGLVLSVVGPSKTAPCRFTLARNRAITHSEIRKLIQQFIEAGKRVQKAGADGIEIHASHGYLIQQFLSPNTNHRKDEYGGSFENRIRFLSEIVQGIKSSCGVDFPILVRLTVDEYYEKIGEAGTGYTLEEGIKIAKYLEKLGVDGINVSSANYETMNFWLEPTTFEPGWRKNLAAAVKKAIEIPVIAANLIRSPEQAEQQIAEGTQDFVALGRPHLADPQWTQKVKEGREREIKRCICCLWCFESMLSNAYTGFAGECAVNPAMGHEKEYKGLKRDGDGRVVVIVGAGPAGLTAAEIFGKRKFKVVLMEKNAFVGGQLQLANKPPLKNKMNWCYEDLERAALNNGVEILLNTEATPEKINQYEPYAVVIATGGSAIIPKSIPGVQGENVCTITEVLDGTVKLSGKTISVIGSGMSGLETAEKLVECGNAVTIIEMAERISPKTYSQHLSDILPKLKKHGVQFITNHKLIRINEKNILLENVKTKNSKEVAGDYVVLAVGVKSENGLYKELEGKFNNLHLIGDGEKIGRIADGTRSAYNLAIHIL